MSRKSCLLLSGVALSALLMLACEQNEQQENASVPSQAAITDQAGPPDQSSTCVLVMGWDPWEPYQFVDARGEVTGLDIEIARAAATAGGCSLELVQASWMELMDRVQTGDVHLLAGATPTPGRAKFAEFTDPYRSESFVVYTLAGNDALQSATELQALLDGEARLGTVAEYYYGSEIAAVLDTLHAAGRLNEAAIAELNYERLELGQIDAFIEDPYVATSILRNRTVAGNVVATGISIDADEVAFMLSKAGVESRHIERFRNGLEMIRSNGQLGKILESWRVTSPAE